MLSNDVINFENRALSVIQAANDLNDMNAANNKDADQHAN